MKAAEMNILPTSAEEATDHYAEHLAEVDKKTDVLATEDIYNNKDVLVTRSGTHIDHGVAKKIVQHKLARPLEEQVELKDSLDTRFLYESLVKLLEKYPDLAKVHAALAFEQEMRGLMLGAPLHKLITQKLTVLHHQLPESFEKALFCAWLSALVLRQLGADRATLSVGVMAGLTHDLGYLHLPSEIVGKRGAWSPEEWRSMQSHVIVGQMFLESVPGLDPRVAQAVLEHHERCDGTGYPTGKIDRDLDLVSKVLGMADSLQAIRMNSFVEHNRTMGDVVPYLQMNDTTHSSEVYRAMWAIIRRSGLPVKLLNSHGSNRMMASHLKGRVEAVHAVYERLLPILDLLMERLQQKKTSSLHNVLTACIDNVLLKGASAGVAGQEVLRWLEVCDDGDEQALTALSEMELVIAELLWHIHNVRRTAGLYFNRECTVEDEHNLSLRRLMEEVDQALGPIAAAVTK